jgi:H/ACA ribonucleoprotein complex subunit 2
MGKERSEKKEKKEKKEKRSSSEEVGVKKSKKEKKSKLNSENVAAALEEAVKVEVAKTAPAKEDTEENEVKPIGALVPFANPLADEKVTKKVLKSVKKGTSTFPYFAFWTSITTNTY